MPTESEQQKWSRESVGWFEPKDASLPKMKKAEAVANLHQFLLHGLENKVTFQQLKDSITKARECLTLKEIAGVCLNHWKMERHDFKK